MGNPSLKDASNGSLGAVRPSKSDNLSANLRQREEILNNLRVVLFQALTRISVDFSRKNDEEWLTERAGHFLEMYRTSERRPSCPNLTTFIRPAISQEELKHDSVPVTELIAATSFIETNVIGKSPGNLKIASQSDESYQIKLHAAYRDLYGLEDVRTAYRCLYKQNRRDANTPAFRRVQHMSLDGPVIDHRGMLEALQNLLLCYDMALGMKGSLPNIDTLNRDIGLQPDGEQMTKSESLNDCRSALKDLIGTLSSRESGINEDIADIDSWDELRSLEAVANVLRTLRQDVTPHGSINH